MRKIRVGELVEYVFEGGTSLINAPNPHAGVEVLSHVYFKNSDRALTLEHWECPQKCCSATRILTKDGTGWIPTGWIRPVG